MRQRNESQRKTADRARDRASASIASISPLIRGLHKEILSAIYLHTLLHMERPKTATCEIHAIHYANMPPPPSTSAASTKISRHDGACQWFLPSFGQSGVQFRCHTKPQNLRYNFENDLSAFWQDNDPDPFKMLASKYASVSSDIPAAQSSFENAERIFLVGSKSQRVIGKEVFLAACPDLRDYVVVRTSTRVPILPTNHVSRDLMVAMNWSCQNQVLVRKV